jgi:hypothetical protein
VTNLDRLSSSGYEMEDSFDEKSKEFDIITPGIPLNEIIETGLNDFIMGNFIKKSIHSQSINNVNFYHLIIRLI